MGDASQCLSATSTRKGRTVHWVGSEHDLSRYVMERERVAESGMVEAVFRSGRLRITVRHGLPSQSALNGFRHILDQIVDKYGAKITNK